MKSSNIKAGDTVYFKDDKYKTEDIYYTRQDGETKAYFPFDLNLIKQDAVSSQISDGVGFNVANVFEMIENDNDIQVEVLDEDGVYFTDFLVDAKFFRSEKKHNKLMKRKQEEKENA